MAYRNEDVVHADLSDGSRIIRQDRAGKYRLEFAPSTGKKSKGLTLTEAVELVVADSGNCRINFGRYGGRIFDLRVRRALAAEQKAPR